MGESDEERWRLGAQLVVPTNMRQSSDMTASWLFPAPGWRSIVGPARMDGCLSSSMKR